MPRLVSTRLRDGGRLSKRLRGQLRFGGVRKRQRARGLDTSFWQRRSARNPGLQARFHSKTGSLRQPGRSCSESEGRSRARRSKTKRRRAAYSLQRQEERDQLQEEQGLARFSREPAQALRSASESPESLRSGFRGKARPEDGDEPQVAKEGARVCTKGGRTSVVWFSHGSQGREHAAPSRDCSGRPGWSERRACAMRDGEGQEGADMP